MVATTSMEDLRMNSKPLAIEFCNATGLDVLPLKKNEKVALGKWTLPSDTSYTDKDGRIRYGIRTDSPKASLTQYGVYLGSEYLVIDLDIKHGKQGIDNWDIIKATLPESITFPPTLTVKTCSGGRHIYYKTPIPLRGCVDGFQDILRDWNDNTLGVDIKTGRAYVVGPGSCVDGAYYEIIDDKPIADLPLETANWFLRELGSVNTVAACPEELLDQFGKLSEALDHCPNESLNYDAWITKGLALYAATAGSDEGLDLWSEWSSRCPGGASFDDCASKWDTFNPTTVGARDIYDEAKRNGFEFSERTEAIFADTDFEQELAELDASLNTSLKEKTRPRSKLQLIDPFNDIIETSVQMIDDILPAFDPHGGTVGLLIGASRAGKSTLISHLAVSLATGRPFLNKEVNGRFGTLILAAEDNRGHSRRVVATQKMHFDGDRNHPWPILQYPMAGERKQVKEFLSWAMQIVTEAKEILSDMGFPLGLIVLDTFSAGMLIQDENDNKEMSDISACWRALSLQAGCVVMPVHHTGKAQGAGSRGASSLPSNADFHWTADADINERDGTVSNRLLSLTKTRDGETGPIAPYDIGACLVGHNVVTGKPITAGYIIETTFEGRREQKASKKEPLKGTKQLIAIINDMVSEGEPLKPDAILDTFMEDAPPDRNGQKNYKKLYGRAFAELMERGQIRLWDSAREITAIVEKGPDPKSGVYAFFGVSGAIHKIELTDKW